MKNLRTTLLILGLLIVGVGSIFIYNRQKETQFLEFEGYEVTIIEKKVEDLFNEDKTDIVKDITDESMDEIKRLITDSENKTYSEKHQARLDKIKDDFEVAERMLTLQLAIDHLFEKEGNQIVKTSGSLTAIEKLESELVKLKDKTTFYNRNSEKLAIASSQIEEIQLATDYIESLFEDGELRGDVTAEELEEAQALLERIKNEKAKEILMAKLNNIEVASAEEIEDEDEELEEELDEEIEDEVVEVEEIEPSEVARDSERQPANRTEPETEPEPATPTRPTTPARPSAPETPSQPELEPAPEVQIVSVEFEQGNKVDIPFDTEKIDSKDLKPGQEVTVGFGKPGQKVEIYEVTNYSDGTQTKKYSHSEVIRQPENKVIQVGVESSE